MAKRVKRPTGPATTQLLEVKPPAGYVAIRVGRAEEDDLFAVAETVHVWKNNGTPSREWYLIVEPLHDWPDWLRPLGGWVSVDTGGAAWWYRDRPKFSAPNWMGNYPSACLRPFVEAGSLKLPKLDGDPSRNLFRVA